MKEFPLEWNECPYCGCEETIANMVFRDQLPPGGKASLKATQIPILPVKAAGPDLAVPKGTVKAIPHLLMLFDYCAGCGREYMVSASVADMVPMGPYGTGRQ